MGTSIIARRVARGVRALEQKKPLWATEVRARLPEFNPQSVHTCILGLVYGSYYAGLENLGIHPAEADQYGFNGTRDAAARKREWKQVIKEAA